MDTRLAVAVHILVLLNTPRGRGLTAEPIARSTGTHPVRVRQLLARLQAAGLTMTRRGRTGGTYLVRSLDDVTLADVYLALYDQPELIPLHATPDLRCPVGGTINIALLAPLAQVDAAVLEVLRRTTIGRLAAAVHRGYRRR